MTTELTITNERIDDFPLLLAAMQRLGLPEILDRHLARHGLQQGQVIGSTSFSADRRW